MSHSCDFPSSPPGDQPLSPVDLVDHARRGQSTVAVEKSSNTRRAYATDWRHFTIWCRRQGLTPLPPDPLIVGRYMKACVHGTEHGGPKQNAVSTITRRLSSLSWNYTQRGFQLDRKDRHIAVAMAEIRTSHVRLPVQKEAVLAQDILEMIETLDRGTLRGMRDRAMLLIGFAGRLRRSEIVGLDLSADQSEDGLGWIEILETGLLVTLRSKTGLRKVEIMRGSSDPTCPVVAVETWIRFARIEKGPLFRRVRARGKDVGPDRLNDREVARLVKKAALVAGIRGDLKESHRPHRFSGHSLRARPASPAELDESDILIEVDPTVRWISRKQQQNED